MDPSNSPRSKSLSPPSAWVSTRSHEDPPVDRPLRCRRRGPCRRKPLNFPSSSPKNSPSPPRSTSRISLPILPGRYGDLRPQRPDWPENNWRSPLPLVGYERRSRMLELTPSPSHGADDSTLRSRVATPHRATEWPARLWRLLDAPIIDQAPRVEILPLPPLAVEEEGPKESDSMPTLPIYYYRNGMPVYFPFHPTTEEWAACEAFADRVCEAEEFHIG